MKVAYYFDHNVVRSITEACRSRGLNVLTAMEDGMHQQSDLEIVARATELGRAVFTQDADFIGIASVFLREQKPFAGVVFGHQRAVSIGKAISDLETIVEVLTSEELINQLIRLPL